MNKNIAAVVYIGSRVIQFNVSELSKGNIRELDRIAFPSDLGHETFSEGRIGYETVKIICERIKGFIQIAKGYGVDSVSVFATTALRDAINRYYILDQIKIGTGLDVEIIEDAEEKRLFYDHIMQKSSQREDFVDKNAIIAYIGTGSIGATYSDSEHIVHTQNIPLGTLKLREALGDEYGDVSDFYIFMEEYLQIHLKLFHRNISPNEAKHFIVVGKQTELLARIFHIPFDDGVGFLDKKNFMKRYNEIKNNTPEQIAYEMNMRIAETELLLPALCIYKTLFDMTSAPAMTVLQVDFSQVLMWRTLLPDVYKVRVQAFRDHTVASARYLAKQYGYEVHHARMVEEIALNVFEKIKSISGLGKKDRVLLQTAAILHSIGQFEGIPHYQEIIYDMIKCFHIVGMRQRDMLLVAETGFKAIHNTNEGEFIEGTLSKGQQIKITKMAAILRMAEALDFSEKQKFKKYQVEFEESGLVFSGETSRNTLLEEWAFKQAAEQFKEIFGIDVKLTVKRCYDEL